MTSLWAVVGRQALFAMIQPRRRRDTALQPRARFQAVGSSLGWKALRMCLVCTAAATTVFTDNNALQMAASAYCSDAVAAETTYGPIADWDVSAITSMAYLFCASDRWCGSTACATFNADLSSWDVGSVTNMLVSGSHPGHDSCSEHPQRDRPHRPPSVPPWCSHAAPAAVGAPCTAAHVLWCGRFQRRPQFLGRGVGDRHVGKWLAPRP